jgi:dienelactone hydrolase
VIDYLATRPEVDAKQLAVFGQSLGGALSFWLTAADPRVRATVISIAGAFEVPADAENAPLRAYYDPAALKTYAAAVSPRPVLMLSSKNDPIVRPADTNRLFESLAEPKQIEWYESGHNLPRPGWDLAAGWLAKQFGIDAPLTTQPATQPTK